MKIEEVILLLSILQLASAVNYTRVDKCADNITVPDVRIYSDDDFCSESPCSLHGASSADLIVEFFSPDIIEKMKPKIKVIFAGMPLDFPPRSTDVCSNLLNTICPLAEGERVVYKYSMHIPFTPGLSASLEFSIHDENKEDAAFVCFAVGVSVTW